MAESRIPIDSPRDAAKGAAGGAVAGAVVGLDRAAQVAGDVLRGIFGGLPWEMSASEIVDAVAGGAGTILVEVSHLL